MTNIFGRKEKALRKKQLFQVGIDALKKEGWDVQRVPKGGKSSLRRITKGGEQKLVSIRTTQDCYIAFPRKDDGTGWLTLDAVGLVVAVSVDDPDNPKFAQVHLIDADEMRDRFDRAYRARLSAGHKIPEGRGVWISLYGEETGNTVSLVGAGAGLKNPAMLRVPLEAPSTSAPAGGPYDIQNPPTDKVDDSLTIPEAKRRLAATFGVDPSDVKIMVEA